MPSQHARGVVTLNAILAVATAATIALFSSQVSSSSRAAREQAALKARPIVPPPLLLRPIAPVDALKINRSIPFSSDPNTAARPFKARGDRTSLARAVECLATAIYYEAATEPLDGQRAVAQIVLNRVRHPAFVPSVCGVVYQGSTRVTGCQFSFTCDGSMRRKPSISGWATARAIAARALAGAVVARVGNATHYHADYVVPYWATSLAKNAVIGRHIFYRWPGWWGTNPAFSRKHSGEEPDPRLLRATALRTPRPEEPAASDQPVEAAAKPDPRVEFSHIVQFLAAGAPRSEQTTPYEDAVRKHFSPFSEHLAVQIYRQLSAGDSKFKAEALLATMMQHSDPPQLTPRGKPSPDIVKAIGGTQKLYGLMAALRDFAKQSDFAAFFKEQQSYYAQRAADAAKPAPAVQEKAERAPAPEAQATR